MNHGRIWSTPSRNLSEGLRATEVLSWLISRTKALHQICSMLATVVGDSGKGKFCLLFPVVFVCVLLILSALSTFGFEATQHCTQRVDVIITVHNALVHLRQAIQSIETSEIGSGSVNPICANVFLVDSSSDLETSSFLSEKSQQKRRFIRYFVLRMNSSSYTSAANAGIAAGTSSVVALLNSDIIVPYFWLSRMMTALASRPSVGIVGPMSNSACFQSLPRVTPSRWAHNALPKGLSIQSVNDFLQTGRVSRYPAVPLLNGFVIAFKRTVVTKIGLFDEEAFPEGYGEENDFCFRARRAGFTLNIADDVFVYHAKSASFGAKRRHKLIAEANVIYSEKLRTYIRLAHEELMYDALLQDLRKQSSNFYQSHAGNASQQSPSFVAAAYSKRSRMYSSRPTHWVYRHEKSAPKE
jgi:GT2 family glycosyltransferase